MADCAHTRDYRMSYDDGTSECACGQTFSTDGHPTDSFEFHKEKTVAFQPIQITRIDANHYVVGAVHLIRQEMNGATGPDLWVARPHNNSDERPLFTAATLEEILDMAHGACEMMRPANLSHCIECGAEIPVGHFCEDCKATS
jgi:hypothetical protein